MRGDTEERLSGPGSGVVFWYRGLTQSMFAHRFAFEDAEEMLWQVNPRNSRAGKFLTLIYRSPSDKRLEKSPQSRGQHCSRVCLLAKTGAGLVLFLLRGGKQLDNALP